MTLPYIPHGHRPTILGDENGADARLFQIRFYPYKDGMDFGSVAWITGSDVQRLIEIGHLVEIESANTPKPKAKKKKAEPKVEPVTIGAGTTGKPEEEEPVIEEVVEPVEEAVEEVASE
jgi:hypothetical protein